MYLVHSAAESATCGVEGGTLHIPGSTTEPCCQEQTAPLNCILDLCSGLPVQVNSPNTEGHKSSYSPLRR